MKILLLSTVLLVICSTSNILGQSNYKPGYIITNELDTVSGLIDSRTDARNSRLCTFINASSSEKVKLLPGDIFAYKFDDGKFYTSMSIPVNNGNLDVFLELIIDGIADLYFYGGKDADYFFITKDGSDLIKLTNYDTEYITGNGQIITRSSKQYQSVLTVLFNDSYEIRPQISLAEFTHSSLAALVESYNKYVGKAGEENISYLKEAPLARFDFGVYGGYSNSDLTYKSGSCSYFDIVSENYTAFGAFMEIYSPRLYERIIFRFNLESGSKNYHASYTSFEFEEYSTVDRFQRDLKYLLWSASANYIISRGVIEPYFGLGIGGQINFSDKAFWSSTSYLSGIEESFLVHDDAPKSPYIFLTQANIGTRFFSSGRVVPFLEFRLNYGTSITNYRDVKGNVFHNYKTVGFAGGIRF